MFGVNGLVSRSTPSGGTTFYAFDERGNVSQRTNGSGAVTSTDLYDGFGKRRSGAADVFGFGGQAGYYTDTETGLILCTNRHYDPQSGRFLTRDPLGYGGGINLYSYTANDPVNELDPLGLQSPAPIKPPHWWRPGGPYYPGVPEHPKGVDILDNIATAQRQEGLLGLGTVSWFHDQVQTGGPWDYKQWGLHYPPPSGSSFGTYQYDNFGNFNYGATAAAMGAPLWFALRKADEAHLHDHHGQAPNPHDHGDDWIIKGYEWYQKRTFDSGCHAMGP